MSKDVEQGEMTDHQKAKDTFSLHQDALVWSRTQTLIAIQGGVLGGTYALRHHPSLGVPLSLLGVALTVILLWIVERDQKHRDLAFGKTGLLPTRPKSCITGRELIRVVYGLMLAADMYLLVWMAVKCGWITPGAH